MNRISLPVDAALPQILAELAQHGAITLASPPGSGKTTRVPAALLDALPTDGGGVVVLEPRRIAARAAARRVAAERGVRLGDEVGYEVRDDRRVSKSTRLRFVTEGVLVQRVLRDPFLEGVSVVVLDEFHERHVETDLALAMLREVRQEVREDLQIVVMSATLDVAPVRAFLAPCGHCEAEGTLHEVAVRHLGARDARRLDPEEVRAAVQQALAETGGDVLVFLPGMGEIRRVGAALVGLQRSGGTEVLPLHGSLPAAEQDAAIRPSAPGVRKVVLSTNVAESSLTIEGVTAVVDAGLARVLRHDPARGLDALRVERISLASAKQRAGRAGRTGPGVCYRLWSAGEERGMAEFDTAEIRRVDLAGPSLMIRAFAGRDPAAFGWFDPPDAAMLDRADELLRELGFVAPDGTATPSGRTAARVPLHPRLAKMMEEAGRRDCLAAAALVAAILDERDVRGRRQRTPDLESLFADVAEFERRGAKPHQAEALDLDPGAARAALRTRDRLLPRGQRGAATDAEAAALGCAVLAGFPDRVACRRERADGERGVWYGQLAGGRGVELRGPEFADVELLVALRVDDDRGGSWSRVSLALPIERPWLEAVFPGSVRTERVAEFDASRQQVYGITRTRFFGLTLEESPGGKVEPAEVEALLGTIVARDPLRHLGDARPVERFLGRLEWLRRAEGEDSDLPLLDGDAVGATLASLAPGRRSLRAFRDAPLLEALRGRLSHGQRTRLDREAPDRIELVNGRAVRVDYEPGPVLASRLQDFFGVCDTPRLAGGRVPVTLHLLAPNQRPVQITSDLASFWDSIYPKVRSELRNRYPKHAWPEDPRTAKPDRPRGRRRR